MLSEGHNQTLESDRADADAGGSPALRVRLDPDISFSSRVVGGHSTLTAHHQTLGKFFQFGPEEFRVASLLDGQRSVAEIAQQVASEGVDWTARDVADFVAALIQQRVAIADPVPSPHSALVPNGVESGDPDARRSTSPIPDRRGTGSSLRSGLVRGLSGLISQRIPLFHADAAAEFLSRYIGWLFTPFGVGVWSILIGSSLLIVLADHASFTRELGRLFDPGLWSLLLVLWCLIKIIHEAGHAVAAKQQGVTVGTTGVMFFLLAPLAYVDVTGGWKLKGRWSRVQIALGGVYLELMVAALAAWAWWLLPTGLLKHVAAQVVVVAGPATLLVNANPLLRLDGYYVVSDLTDIANLRMHGRRQLIGWLEWMLLGMQRARPLLSGWRRTFATVHAACSVVFQVIWMSGLVMAVSIWARGLGIVLGVAAVLLWCVLPLMQWVAKIWTGAAGTRRRRRLVLLGAWAVTLIHLIGTSPSPLQRRVPVVVRYRDEQIARASSDAFVRSIHVKSGQRVSPGMLLMTLENVELSLRHAEMKDELELAQRRAVQYRRQRKLGLVAAETETAASLRRRVAELDQQLDSLRIVADREGLVISPRLERLQDRFVHAGDELLRVADPHEMELLVSVSEHDTQAFEQAILRNVPTHVRLRGGQVIAAQPARLRPRATESLPHPALAASAAGPLAVESGEKDGEVRLIEPRLISVTPLSPVTSAEVRAGQRGAMSISDNRTLFVRLMEALQPPA